MALRARVWRNGFGFSRFGHKPPGACGFGGLLRWPAFFSPQRRMCQASRRPVSPKPLQLDGSCDTYCYFEPKRLPQEKVIIETARADSARNSVSILMPRTGRPSTPNLAVMQTEMSMSNTFGRTVVCPCNRAFCRRY